MNVGGARGAPGEVHGADDRLVARLGGLAALAGEPAGACGGVPGGTSSAARAGAGPVEAGPAGVHGGAVAVLARRADATVVRVGGAVAKAHPPGTDTGALRVRLGVAAHPLSRGVLLPPYGVEPAVLEGRAVSVWPYGVPVDPGEPEAAPWEEAATLLARLHAIPPDDLPGPLPPMRGPAKVAGAMARLRGAPDSAAARTVRRAWRRLPAWARDEAPYEGRSALCHGDWHLGQLVHAQAEGRVPPPPAGDGPLPGPRAYPPAPAGWRLIDVDDLGVGDPAWDLARPAMWFGAGLLAPGTWARFLDAYRAAGGRAVAAAGDPWRDLDVPARALAVQSAATAVAKAARDGREPDEAESQLIGACARIAQLQ